MIIKPVCPHCGKVITINVKRVDTLEKETKRLRDLLQSYNTPDEGCEVIDDLLDMFSGKTK